jgi:hypothetical protein
MFNLFPWLVALAVLAAVTAWRKQKAQHKALREQWNQAAELLGFSPTHSATRGVSMLGKSNGLKATIDVRPTKGNTGTTVTRYRVEYPSLRLGLELSQQTRVHGLLKTLGAQDIEIGNAEFDAQFMVKGDDAGRVKQFLTTDRTVALNALARDHPGVTITDESIELTTAGAERDVQLLVSTARQVMTAAVVMAREAEPVAEMAAGLAVEDDDLGGDYEEARRRELQKVFGTVEAYTEEVADEAIPVDLEDGEPAVVDDSSDVATRLFGDHRLSFQAEKVFDTELRDRVVDWSGTVRDTAGSSANRWFAEEDPTVLVVNVAELDDDLYGTTPIDAYVAFDTGRDLPETGSEIRFSGRLVGIDGVSRRLYVGDAELS